MQCKGGTFIMDFKSLTSEAQEKQYEWARRKGWTSYDYLEYPPQLSVGEHLKDGKFHNDRNNGQGVQLVDMNLTERKVEGKESITTPAGTWDCFKISYKFKTAIQFYGNVNVVNMECMEWYAPGFGVVKTQYKDYGSAELISVR